MFKKVLLSELITGFESGSRPKGNSDDIPSLGGQHINSDGSLNLNNMRFISYENYKKMKKGKIRMDDILVVKDGATTGKVAFINSEFPYEKAVVNEHLFRIQIDSKKVLPKYVFLFLNSKLGKKELLKDFRGATVGGISRNFVNLVNIPFTQQKKKQNQIVQILDKTNKIIKLRQQQITALSNLADSIFIDMFGSPNLNQHNYPTLQLSKAGVLQRGKSKHRPRNAPELLGGSYPLIQTGDIKRNTLYIREYKQTYSELGLQQSKLWPKGTLCITIAANIAHTGILTFDACFPDSIVAFKPNAQISPVFVHYWFSFLQSIIEANAPESAQKNINLKILSELDIIIPPFEKQKEFEQKVDMIEQNKIKMLNSLKHYENLYNSLMQKAFKGELFQDEDTNCRGGD